MHFTLAVVINKKNMASYLMNIWILLIGIILSLDSCGQKESISESDLVGCWTDSREENTTDSELNIFRPCDFKVFPASRYRYLFELNANHKCSWLYLAPNDAHHMVDGTWTYNKESRWLEIFDLEGNSVNKLKVSELDKDLMKIENIKHNKK